jgi:hypothetical protein
MSYFKINVGGRKRIQVQLEEYCSKRKFAKYLSPDQIKNFKVSSNLQYFLEITRKVQRCRVALQFTVVVTIAIKKIVAGVTFISLAYINN